MVDELLPDVEEMISEILLRSLDWADDQDDARRDIVSEICEVFAKHTSAAPEPSEDQVEAVARAIYGAENPQGRLWEDRADGTRGTYLVLARAAIAALRTSKQSP